MKKSKTYIYKCSACGHEEPKWLGRCPECGEWNTLIETSVSGRDRVRAGAPERGMPRSLPLSAIDPQEGNRISSGIGELDRVLGGGIMKRSAILVGGEPGIGKSTLLLQAAAVAETTGRILYISGEESAGQVRMRADRLGLLSGGPDTPGASGAPHTSGGPGVRQAGAQAERIEIVCSARLEDIGVILDAVKPVIIIVDSVQSLFSPEVGLVPGTVNQMKYCSFELISWVKEHDAALFLVAHVTKDGIIAGPKTLEHMVDTVLYFEQSDRPGNGQDSRFLRAAKNRFGSVDELGIFTMTEKGLKAVEDPSSLFLIRREGELPPGVAVAAVLEGSRCFLVEIQALTVPARASINRVFSDRIDSGRVSRVSATLEKHLKLRLQDHDLYVNVAGGIRINEVGIELALAGAIYSARTGLALPSQTALAGELSLAGEVRPVRRLNTRVKTSRSLGFTRFLGPVPDSGETETAPADSAGVHKIASLKNAVTLLFAGQGAE